MHCPWTAQSGTYYYVTETYTDAQGRTRTRQVRRVSWRPVAGVVDPFFDDVPVAASVGVDADLLGRIEPFPPSELVAYDTAYLSGFVVEHYQVVLIERARRGRERMEARLRELCTAEIPGDTHRGLQMSPAYSEKTFKLILAPVWLLTYDYARKSYQVVANGQSGRLAGHYPKSLWKISLAFLAVLVAVLAAVYFGGL